MYWDPAPRLRHLEREPDEDRPRHLLHLSGHGPDRAVVLTASDGGSAVGIGREAGCPPRSHRHPAFVRPVDLRLVEEVGEAVIAVRDVELATQHRLRAPDRLTLVAPAWTDVGSEQDAGCGCDRCSMSGRCESDECGRDGQHQCDQRPCRAFLPCHTSPSAVSTSPRLRGTGMPDTCRLSGSHREWERADTIGR